MIPDVLNGRQIDQVSIADHMTFSGHFHLLSNTENVLLIKEYICIPVTAVYSL